MQREPLRKGSLCLMVWIIGSLVSTKIYVLLTAGKKHNTTGKGARQMSKALKAVNINDVLEMRRTIILLRREAPIRLGEIGSRIRQIESEAGPCLFDREYKALRAERERLSEFMKTDGNNRRLAEADPLGYHGKVGYFHWFVWQ
ncbi:MAG: hypothetical protein HZA95_00295 [Candidatus Vogelbacteria bacterium]|nr:hypothetical protein [Candidatus Vogelbacteria bacterium]